MDTRVGVAHSRSAKKKQDASGRLEPVRAESAALRLITALHRGGDSYVTFHRKSREEGRFENLFSIRADHLRSELPRRLDQLCRNSYFSINGLWHPVLKHPSEVPVIAGVHSRKVADVRFINAAYVDIDCYKKGFSIKSVLAKVGGLIENGSLPPPSFGLCGHGLWLFWLLHDDKEPASPPHYSDRNLKAHRSINETLCALLRPLGADPTSVDAARTTRVPGSINSRNHRIVQVLWPPSGGAPETYTLNELTSFFQLHEPARPPTLPKTLHTPALPIPRPRPLRKNERRRFNPWTIVNYNRFLQFRELWRIRGGFMRGCRNHAALIYARLLTTYGANPSHVRELVEEFGLTCRPPLKSGQIRDAVVSGTKPLSRSITNERISEWLAITWEEHVALKQEFVRYAWKSFEKAPPSRVELRRKEIQHLVRKYGVLPVRVMAVLLNKRGHPASPTQVAKDYKFLGLKQASGKRRRGRRPRNA